MVRYSNLVIIFFAFLFSNGIEASIVKKSKSGICHDENSPYYDRTKNFHSFNSIQSCLESGGRLPKSQGKPSVNKQAIPDEIPQQLEDKSEYSRSKFGNGWADEDGDCQNSRMEALISQSLVEVRFRSNRMCKVESGKWISPFTGNTIFKASEIDIDHVVPLSWAWKHGANKWTNEKRVKFANDPANLLSVESSLNRSKGDKGPDEWLPPKNQCQYILRFQRVYKTYDLLITNVEAAKLSVIQKSYCGSIG